VEDRVLHLLQQVCSAPPDAIRPEDRLREDLGMDSVASMELLSLLAETLDVSVEMEDAAQVRTVGQVVDLVRGKVHA
jgi:acyl carrier protein